jgi:hypothetical protein
VLSGGAALLARAHLAAMERATTPGLADLGASLRRLPMEQRRDALLTRTSAGSWLHELAAALSASSDDAVLVAALNDALLERAHTLARGEAWPRVALRLSLAGAGLCAVAAFLLSEARLVPILLGLGGAAAVVSAHAGRKARDLADAERRGIDALVALLAGPLAASAPRGATRRARRGRP